jgi:hypothetical protein
VFEDVARQHGDVGRRRARRREHAGERCRAVAAVEARRVVVVDVEIRAVHDHDSRAPCGGGIGVGWRCGHGMGFRMAIPP